MNHIEVGNLQCLSGADSSEPSVTSMCIAPFVPVTSWSVVQHQIDADDADGEAELSA